MIGVPEYKLTKLLDFASKQFIPDKYMLPFSTDFKKKLHQFKSKSKQHLVSFDVNSLFTNVPLNETINLITTKIYSETVDEALKSPIKKKSFVKLLKLATQCMFIYKDKVFQRIDYEAMSSPLGPTMAQADIDKLTQTFKLDFFNRL